MDFAGHQVPSVVLWSLLIVLLKYLDMLALFKLLFNRKVNKSIHFPGPLRVYRME